MSAAKSWEELVSQINQKAQSALKSEVFEEVRDVYQKHIDSDVYDAYSPHQYQRRDMGGGLIADDNIVGNVNGNTLEVKDIASLNDFNFNGEIISHSSSGTELAEIIEYGSAYSGNAPYLFDGDMSGQPWAVPRPFTENTIKDLQSNKQHIKALRQGLNRQGIKTK